MDCWKADQLKSLVSVTLRREGYISVVESNEFEITEIQSFGQNYTHESKQAFSNNHAARCSTNDELQ